MPAHSPAHEARCGRPWSFWLERSRSTLQLLTAIDASSGEIAWETVLGICEAWPPEKQLVGSTDSAGPIVTASSLVFVGATSDRRLRAFDAQAGNQRWEVKLESNVNANPMTYLGRDGKQYVAVVADVGGLQATLRPASR